ncbi:MAG: hypothetical protein QG666_148, partial [Euryarchaeota archaeon]|nr:hypothetical protein [Euryarchaeota archaeon]
MSARELAWKMHGIAMKINSLNVAL